MTTIISERMQRQVTRMLGEMESALASRDWRSVRDVCQDVLALEPDNVDAQAFLAAAARALQRPPAAPPTPTLLESAPSTPDDQNPPPVVVNHRYTLGELIGEGSRKRVYSARDSLLDRQVALAVVKPDALDEPSRKRNALEAQSIGRLGSHPHVVAVYDYGEFTPQGSDEPHPYIVTELMDRGDVAMLIANAPDNRPEIDLILRVGGHVSKGLTFAHSYGVVHRDVKPGNIWLTSDGTAKIGDFGLAKSPHRVDITLTGNIVGTVTYMSPEQFTGGEATPSSDLYALGVMLYEMVCGRPPFMGYDTATVSRQHMDARPVDPSWHNPECPEALEALLLRMLAKEPKKRPQSAAEVTKALKAIRLRGLVPGAGPRRNGGKAAGGRRRDREAAAFDREFVGRFDQIAALREAFDEAIAGRGRLVVIEGEPGAGKTRTAQELAAYATARGAKTLWGEGKEEASLPYQPWAAAFDAYAREEGATRLAEELGDGAAEIATISPEVRRMTKSYGAEETPSAFRLSESIAYFVSAASRRRPLALFLDNLHHADEPSLDLLQSVLGKAQTMRALFVLTTLPPSALPEGHPVAELLAAFERRRRLRRARLPGLTIEESVEVIEKAYGVTLAPTLAKGVYSRTKGNPRALSEVADALFNPQAARAQRG